MAENSLINPHILDGLNSDDKTVLLESLATLIEGTYGIEQEFKKLQNDFSSLKALYEWVLELIPQAIWVLEESGDIFYKNAQASGLGETFLANIFHKHNETIEREIEHKGQFYLLQSNIRHHKQVISATNITKQRRQERLASMGQVSAHLAHEIRNPIGSISLLASSLLKRGDEKVKPLVFEIKRALWRVERLINATLLFTKGVQINRQNYELAAFKDELNSCIEYYTYSKPIQFDFALDVDEILWVDFDLLSIVLQNFLSNAIDAIEEGECEEGKVVVRFKSIDGFWCFILQDNGVAIEDENILFEPFKTTKLKGNGLGLALANQIVQSHNGEICFFKNASQAGALYEDDRHIKNDGKLFVIKIGKRPLSDA